MVPPHATNGTRTAPTAAVTASQQPRPPQQQLLPLLKHVEAFAKIVNVSQTLQLHEWNVESLQRALQWARFLERGTRRYDAQQQQQLDALLRDTFPAMALPSFAKGDVMNTHTLQNASQHLTRSLLQSAFLSSHPIRSEMLLFILQHAAAPESDSSEAASGTALEPVGVSAVLADRTVLSQKRVALAQIAHVMSTGCQRIHVQVSAGTVTIAPLQSYTLQPRTLELRVVAKTLQANAISAYTLTQASGGASLDASGQDATTFTSFVDSLAQQLRDSSASSDVLEVIALTVAGIDWPDTSALTVRDTITARVLVPAITAAPQQLWRLAPWLCAMLAAQCSVIRAQYVAHLTRSGFLEPLAEDFAARVATLVLQSDDAARDVTTALQHVEPLVLERFFGNNAVGS